MDARILITNSNNQFLTEAVTALEEHSYQVTTAYNATDFKTAITDTEFDAVIVDIDLPDLGGVDILQHIKQQHFETRVLIVSQNKQSDVILKAMTGDASNFLTPPYTAKELVKAVEHALSEKQALEQIQVEVGQEGWIELMMPSSLNYMTRMDRFFRLFYEQEVPLDQLDEISYCFKEIVKNAIEWGHRGDVHKKVKIGHVLFQDQFCFKIEDSGNGYDVQKVLFPEEPSLEDLESMEEDRLELGLRPGGLGMNIVRELMDDIIMNAKGNMSILSKDL